MSGPPGPPVPPGRTGPTDPTGARTPTDYVERLAELKRWAGEPSLSRLRALAGRTATSDGAMIDALPKSTTSHVLRQTGKLPRWEFVQAFVTACLRYSGHPAERIPEELERWRAARNALTAAALSHPPVPAIDEPAAEGPAAEEPASRPDRAARPDEAAELLVRRVAREEDRARKGLLGGYSVAPVCFGSDDVVNDWTDGDLHSIGRFFLGLSTRRLLIVGEPGAGKTVLAIELVLQLIEPFIDHSHEPAAGPALIPVRLNAARWTSGAPFESWLADQLVRDFGLPERDAVRLVEERRVLPVLDGLDELDPEPSTEQPRLAIGLLTELNRYSHITGRRPGAVVVTCRADRYAELTEAGARLDHATRIHLHDLTIEQITAYLDARWPDDHPCARKSDGVRDALLGPSGPAVRAALATPWRLLLAATAVESGADPAELLKCDPDAGRSVAAADIAERLLEAYVPAATRLAPRGGHRHAYRPDQVRSWLVTLAAHLQWQATESARGGRAPAGLTGIDIVPHLLWPIGGRRRVRTVHGLCSVILAAIAMWAFWAGSAIDRVPDLQRGLDTEEIVTFVLMAGWVAIAAGLSLSRWPAATGGRTAVSVRQRAAGGLLGAVAGGVIGVLGGLAGLALTGGRVFGLGFAITAGAAGGVVFGAVLGVTAAGAGGSRRMTAGEAVRADPAMPLGFGICGALTGLPPLRLAHAGPFPLVLGAAGAFILAFALGVVFKMATGGWSKDAELAHPREALHRNPMIGVAFGLTGGVAAALVFAMNQGVTESLVWALVGAVTFGLAFGAVAWARSMIGLAVAAARGVLPLRLWTFLDWACEARLLRISGATYQFRHRELQDFLTS